jgi:hypothetical protein
LFAQPYSWIDCLYDSEVLELVSSAERIGRLQGEDYFLALILKAYLRRGRAAKGRDWRNDAPVPRAWRLELSTSAVLVAYGRARWMEANTWTEGNQAGGSSGARMP